MFYFSLDSSLYTSACKIMESLGQARLLLSYVVAFEQVFQRLSIRYGCIKKGRRFKHRKPSWLKHHEYIASPWGIYSGRNGGKSTVMTFDLSHVSTARLLYPILKIGKELAELKELFMPHATLHLFTSHL